MNKLIPVLLVLASPGVLADFLDDVGFSALQAAVGGSLENGAGVLPTLVEASVTIEGMKEVWFPDPGDSEFGNVTFVPRTAVPPALQGLYSPHATGTARRMLGATSSMTPGIPIVDVYNADDWLTNFLRVGEPGAPLASDSRIGNHSYVAKYQTDAENIDALQRIDWLINRDEFVQIVGNRNSGTPDPLLANAFNVIAVGKTQGDHSSGTLNLDATYVGGRANPQIVAPLGTTSAATAVVTSAATLLIDTATGNPGLSLEADQLPRSASAAPVSSAAGSEVIKAVLMAGADRETDNSTGPDITDYRESAANQTANGLDVRYGAGQLNIKTSYDILSAGEQNSVEDGGGTLLWQGFDYDPQFGGEGASNAVANYAFNTDALAASVTAALVWNLSVDEGGEYDPAPQLYNLDLQLWQVDGNDESLVASSTSIVDNTENLWTSLLPASTYELRVTHTESTPFVWDYAIAWRVQAVPLPPALPMLLAALGVFGATGWRRKR